MQPENSRDGNWSSGFTAERDLILRHVATRVSGRTLFVTGDTHYTMVYDRAGLFEARPCPLDIPTPNDITLVDPFAAQELRRRPGIVYADDRQGHFALLEASGHADTARLDLTLVRQDGAEPYRRRFEEPIRVASGRGRGRRPTAGGRRAGADQSPGRGASAVPERGRTGLAATGSRVAAAALAGAAAATAGTLLRAALWRRGRSEPHR